MAEEKIHILIVDDDQVDRMIVKRALGQTGFDVETQYAEDVHQGMNAVRSHDFECIFIDYNMPDGSGLSMLQQLRKMGCNTPVILVTSQGDERLAVEAMRTGAMDYIPKNLINGESLSQSLRYIIRIREAELARVAMENALRESEQRLDRVISHSPILLFALDQLGKFTIFKGKEASSFISEGDTLVGKSLQEAFSNFPQLNESFGRALSGEEFVSQIRFGRKYFEIYFSPLRNIANEVTGVFGVASDVSTHKKLELELNRAKINTEQTAKMKEQFLANMTHELRTPMHCILGLTEMLEKSSLDEEQKNHLGSIGNSAENLLVIINDMLDLSKIEAGKMTFESAPFSLRDTVRANFELLSPKVKEKNLEVKISIDDNIADQLVGDKVRLGQIIINLVGNAIKFTEKGTVGIKASLTEDNPAYARIRFDITDTGIGIAQEKLDTIFESFTQAEADTTRKYGGTGLGLSIVKKLVELQEGELNVTSIAGVGTTFSFTISFIKAVGEAAIQHQPISQYATANFNGMRVLLVDDNPINMLIARNVLKEFNTSVVEASDGKQAIDLLKENEFDIVLLDVMMPEMNGYETARYIRENFDHPVNTIPILAMTAHSSKPEFDKCFASGMNDYISKPFKPAELAKKISLLTCHANQITPVEIIANTVADVSKEVAALATDATKSNNNVDLKLLRQMSGNDPVFIKEMLNMFIENTPKGISELNNHAEKADWESMNKVSHQLRPTFAYFGLKGVEEDVACIEKYSKSQSNLDDIKRLIDNIYRVYKAALADLQSELIKI